MDIFYNKNIIFSMNQDKMTILFYCFVFFFYFSTVDISGLPVILIMEKEVKA